ncbi:MAG: addiction module protein [Pirellulales bacterium]
MNPNIDQFIDSALALPDGERLELVEAVLASLRPEDRPPFDEAWRPVIERRSQELLTGDVIGVPWSEVKRRGQEQQRG